MSASVKKKRRCLSISEKIDVIQDLLRGEKNKSVCIKYSLKSSTVSTLWKNRANIVAALAETHTSTKKLRKCELADLDAALFDWFTQQSDAGVPINGPTLKLHAEKLAKCLGHQGFTCNNGWLGRFKFRHNIAYASVRGVTTLDEDAESSEEERKEDEDARRKEFLDEEQLLPLDLSKTSTYK